MSVGIKKGAFDFLVGTGRVVRKAAGPLAIAAAVTFAGVGETKAGTIYTSLGVPTGTPTAQKAQQSEGTVNLTGGEPARIANKTVAVDVTLTDKQGGNARVRQEWAARKRGETPSGP